MTPTQIEVLKEFRHFNIRYLVVGGQAMRAHGIERRTKDLDLWVARDRSNAQALARFMRRVQNLPPLERLQKSNFKFTIGEPSRPEVDILTSVAGDPPFNEALSRCQRLMLDTRRVPVIGLSDLVTIKMASAAQMDLDAANAELTDADREQAAATASKERNDIIVLQAFLGNQDQGGSVSVSRS